MFWAFDRFARSGTLFTLQKLKELENTNIDWHSYSEPYISSIGPWKDVVISIFATIAKIEAERISDRTKAAFEKGEDGVTRAIKSGKKVGRPILPDETTKQVVALLKDGMSCRQISKQIVYVTKYNIEKHVSPMQVSRIKKSIECNKMGSENDT